MTTKSRYSFGGTGRLAVALAIVITSLAATAQAQTRTWTGGGADNLWSNALNWDTGVPGNGSTIIWNASSTGNLVSFNDLNNLSVATINYLAAPDGVVLNGNALTLTGGFSGPTTFTPNGITFNLDIALPANFSFSGDSRNYTVFNGVLSGGADLMTSRRTAPGFYAFYGANTFSGPVILGANNGEGRHIINTLANSGVAQSLGTGSLVQFGRTSGSDRGFLYYTGGETSTDKGFQIGGDADAHAGHTGPTGGVFANGTGALTWSGAQTLATLPGNAVHPARFFTLGGFNTDANTWSSAIGDNNVTNPDGGDSFRVALTKDGRGTWVLSGANTFTGAWTVNSGTLVLDYANNATVINSGNAVTLSGSILEFKGKAGAGNSTTQTLGNLTATDATGLSTIRINQNGGDGVALTLGMVSVNPATWFGPSSVLFDLNGSSGSTVTIGTAITPGSGTNGRILIRTAAGQYDFAHNSGNTANALVAVNSTTQIPASNNGSATTDYVFINSATIGNGSTTAAVATRSLRIAPTENNQVMTLANHNATPGAAGLRVDGQGLLFDGGAHNFTIQAANAGEFSSIHGNDIGAEPSLYHMGTGTLTLDQSIRLGNGVNESCYLIGTQGGLVDFQGRVSSTGNADRGIFGITGDIVVRVSGTTDTIRFDNDNAVTIGAQAIFLGGGGVFELGKNEALTRNLTTARVRGSIRWTGDGGFSAFGGDRTVNLGGGTSAQVTWGSGGFVPDGNALLLSSQYADSLIDFQNPLALGGLQRVVQVANGSADVDARLSGILSGGLTGGLVKEGLGTLELTNANTYGGETWVRAGTLLINGDQSASPGRTTVAADAAIGGNGTIGGDVVLESGAGYAWRYLDGAGDTLAVNGKVTLPATATVNVSGSGALPATMTLFTATTLDGATDLSGWTVTGLKDGKAQIQGTSVILKGTPAGTLIMFR